MNEFLIDSKSSAKAFTHYWETCVGSCHAYTALRADYQRQLAKAHRELGFRYVRFHGLLDDEMSVCLEKADYLGRKSGEYVYNFFNIDCIFDFLLSIGMKPFIELGFMPACLASGEKTCFHYKGNITPPKDYAFWEDLIEKLTRHLLDRYGLGEVHSWFFEVWNEPNLPFFWSGSQQDYFELYRHTVQAIKRVDSAIAVGGPATSINAWIPEMIAYCESNHVPLDFISTHHYPTDDPLWRQPGMTMEEFFTSGLAGTYERGCIQRMTQKAREQAGKYPLYYTEWNISALASDEPHDGPYASAMIAQILSGNDGLVDGYSFWTFTDIFEEGGQQPAPFHGGFGLQNVYGVEKPSYRLFELFHGLGQQRLSVETVGGLPEQNVGVIATKTEQGLRLVAFNHNVAGAPMKAEEISIGIRGLQKPCRAVGYRIDDTHANAKRRWLELGRPEYPDKAELDALREASRLVPEELSINPEGEEIRLQFTLPEYGVMAIDLV